MAQINKPNTYFNSVLYSGNGGTQSITGVNFQPDFSWLKTRNNVYNHTVYDAVRGAGKRLQPNTTNAELTATDRLNSFDADGFTLGNAAEVNENTTNYVSWNWLAGGTAVSNTDGSITSSVSANTTSGFSIVSYSGDNTNTTIGHGLGVAPNMIIIKNRTNTTNYWATYHSSLGNGQLLRINATDASVSAGYWNNTSPTNSVFSTQANNLEVNQSGSNYIAYCFAEKKGFSKFGSYTGNNINDGPFVYTGFKPAWLLIKATNAAQWWTLLDSKRDTYNQASLGISPNSSDDESTFNTNRGPHYMDFLSNGFKIRTSNSGVNGTNSFIYMAFAENPLVGTNNIPATAR